MDFAGKAPRKRKLLPPRKVIPFDERVWGEAEREALKPYADWHARHPLCESPRPVNGKEGPGVMTGELAIDDDDPFRVYHVNLFEREPPVDFLPNYLGSEAQFDEVSIVAAEHETQLRVNEVEDFDDPWWLMSVRENKTLRTPLDHYDDGRSRTSSLKALEKEVEAKSSIEMKRQAIVEQMRQKKMEELALSAQWGKPPRKPKSAWASETKPNRYITGHTKVFEKLNSVELRGNVDRALKLYIDAAAKDKKRQLSEPEPEYERDKYAAVKEQLGGDEAVLRMAENWNKLAANAKKLADKDSGASNPLNAFSLDFIEACELGNVVKVVSLLAVGKGDVNTLIGDDPIFVYLFQKILNIDSLYTPNEVELAVLADADMKISKKMSKRVNKRATFLSNFGGGQDSGRKNFLKVITVLAKFKSDLDAIGGDNLTAVHLAGQFNNAEMAKWVLDRGANPNSRARTILRETPLMTAARYGSVCTMGALMLANANPTDVDTEGNTALHYAALYGQTESALFLLRVNVPKNILNKEGKKAAECAINAGYHSTAQAIMGYAKPTPKVGPVIDYLIDQSTLHEPATFFGGVANAFKRVEDMLSKFSFRGIWNWLVGVRLKILNGISGIVKGRCIKPVTNNVATAAEEPPADINEEIPE